MAHGEVRSRRGRWGLALMAAVGCVAVLLLAGFSPQARARRPPVSRTSASGCPGSGGGSSAFLYGSGAKLVSETDLPLCARGRLTVTFAGDPSAGCAAHGLCGYAGTETWTPQGVGDLAVSTVEQRGRRSSNATMFVGDPGNPVLSAVQRSRATGTSTACSDNSQGEGGFFSVPVSAGRVTIGLGHAEEPLFGTRCAGPLDADVAAALPSRTVSSSQILHGHATIDLTASKRFVSHGLSGTVQSTIVFVLGRPHRSSGSGGSSPPPGVTPSRLTEVTYRVTHVGGSAIAAVRSSAVTAVCGPFDACGLRGVIDVAPGTTSGSSVYLTATASLHRPEHDLLTALGVASDGNPSGIGVQGAGEASVHGEVAADLTQGSACRDQTGLRHIEIELRKRADRLQVSVSPGASQAADPLRTRCPGPELGSHKLTSASIPLSVLRHPSFTVALHGGSFGDGPYRVTTRSTLTITLRRAGVKTQIVPFASRG
jgi:hypothetical protein